MPSSEDLVRQIEKLSPQERIKIIDHVIRDTIKPDADIEKIWVREATARWKSFERGDVETVSYDSVMAKYRNRK